MDWYGMTAATKPTTFQILYITLPRRLNFGIIYFITMGHVNKESYIKELQWIFLATKCHCSFIIL